MPLLRCGRTTAVGIIAAVRRHCLASSYVDAVTPDYPSRTTYVRTCTWLPSRCVQHPVHRLVVHNYARAPASATRAHCTCSTHVGHSPVANHAWSRSHAATPIFSLAPARPATLGARRKRHLMLGRLRTFAASGIIMSPQHPPASTSPADMCTTPAPRGFYPYSRRETHFQTKTYSAFV